MINFSINNQAIMAFTKWKPYLKKLEKQTLIHLHFITKENIISSIFFRKGKKCGLHFIMRLSELF